MFFCYNVPNKGRDNMLWGVNNQYELEPYALEAELETATQSVKAAMFGSGRIYLEIKKRIGTATASGSTLSIPDGYLSISPARKGLSSLSLRTS